MYPIYKENIKIVYRWWKINPPWKENPNMASTTRSNLSVSLTGSSSAERKGINKLSNCKHKHLMLSDNCSTLWKVDYVNLLIWKLFQSKEIVATNFKSHVHSKLILKLLLLICDPLQHLTLLGYNGLHMLSCTAIVTKSAKSCFNFMKGSNMRINIR